MIRHITYCSENMTISAQKCSESALKFGCDTSTIYTYEDLNKFFRLVTTSILLCERGAGYWVWKPQIIQQEMNKGEDGDVIIYTDAGVDFVNDVHHLINAMDQDVMVFGGQYNHREWCKGDVLKHTDIKQLQASCILVNFLYGYNKVVDIWQENTMNKQLIDDSPSIKPNHPDFREHRHDQAILTEVCADYGIRSHWWPATYLDGKFNYPKLDHTDTYPVIFHHHRRRNDEW